MDQKMKKRILMSVIGVLVCGISVGFFKHAVFGVDPFQTLCGGMDCLVPISFGTLYVIINICLLSFSLIADRHYIGLATFINLFLLGYVTEFSQYLLNRVFPAPSLPLRIVFITIGIVVMCFASAFYFTADLGVSTYDAVSLIIAHTWKLMPFKFCRILCDFVCVIIGVVLYYFSGAPLSGIGSIIGVGTIITAFCMGPLIDFFRTNVSEPFLNGK